MAVAINLTYKILMSHILGQFPASGERAAFRIDSVLFHDMSAILPMMGYDAMGLGKANVQVPVVFTDHNMIQSEAAIADNQAFVRSGAKAFGMYYSMAGNGICHSVYAERFARPGMLLIGADSHTATCGAMGMLGIGMGGMDVAVAMSGRPYTLTVPSVIGVRLTGRLHPNVGAKDVALQLLRQLTISGAVGSVLEYFGEGVSTLTVPQRMTLCNLGAEMGATSSVFPADRQVRDFLRSQHREEEYRLLQADANASYKKIVELDLSSVEPMVCLPGRPDRGIRVSEVERVPFSQIFIGSCSNGSYVDIARAAMILRGRRVSRDTTLVVTCGSRQIYRQLLHDGWIEMLTDAGARILESGCGPCMGIGQAPASGSRVLRTSNRNFQGRSGTKDAEIWLSGPEVAAATAVRGVLTSVEELMDPAGLDAICEPENFPVDDALLLDYSADVGKSSPAYTKNIRPIPVKGPLENTMRMGVAIKLGDGISTDDIVPAVSGAIALRSNIPALSQYIFYNIDRHFAERCRAMKRGIIVAGEDYGQGSSREFAAVCCMELGIRAVLAKSFHRIHRSNLINYGIVPLLFESDADYDEIYGDDCLAVENLPEQLRTGWVTLKNERSGRRFRTMTDLKQDELEILFSGGLIPYSNGTKEKL